MGKSDRFTQSQTQSWLCICEQCTQGRTAKPPTKEVLAQLADVIAKRNADLGFVAPKKRKRRKRKQENRESK